MDAGKRQLNDIFNGNRLLEIPFFQRAYVWGEEQWDRMLQDMAEVSTYSKPYFLGSVILKQMPTASGKSAGDHRIVIDGQQRMTTLTILFKVLCLKNDTNSAFERMFMLEDGTVCLAHNHNDIEAFNRVCNLKELKELVGSDKITCAYNHFRKRLDTEKIDRKALLSNLLFVGIDLGENEDEQQIFDTINSLGINLTTAELLKNYFFNRDEFSAYETYWKSVFEADDDSKAYWDRKVRTGRLIRDNIDVFFYAFLAIRTQREELSVNTEDRQFFRRTDKLFESYKRFIADYGIDRIEILHDIREYARIYQENIDANAANSDIPAQPGIERINGIIFGLETTTLIPYVLYVLKNQPDAEERDRVFAYLEAYIMRRMIVKASTKNYNQLFQERLIARNLLTVEALRTYIETQEDKTNYMPSDEDLKVGFHHSRLINKQTTGILYYIESRIRSVRHATNLKGLGEYSLEHVMPKKWENNWKSGVSNQEDRLRRSSKLLTLGNLTIIPFSLNASLRDANWKTKVKGRSGKKGLKHYASGIETFSDFLDWDQWDESTIENRADRLYQWAKEIWRTDV